MAGLLLVERCLLHCPHHPSLHSRRLLRRAGATRCTLRRTQGGSSWTTRCGLASIFGRKKRGGKNKKRPQRNALDTTMAWGDIMTLLATQLASHRTAPNGALVSVLVLAWVATATAKGDYRLGPIPFGHSSAHRDATVSALLSSALTWMLFLPTSLVVYAALVTHHWLDVGPFAASPDPYELPAQVEVLFAALWSVAAWRGIYTGLRPYI